MSSLIISLIVYGVFLTLAVTSIIISGVSLSRSKNGVNGVTGARGPSGAAGMASTITGPTGGIGTGPTGPASIITGPTGPSGPSFPVADSTFSVFHTGTPTRLFGLVLGNIPNTTTNFLVAGTPGVTQAIVFLAPTGTTASANVVYDQSVYQQVYRLNPINYPGTTNTMTYTPQNGSIVMDNATMSTNTDMAGYIVITSVSGTTLTNYRITCAFTPAFTAGSHMPHAIMLTPMTSSINVSNWFIANQSSTGFDIIATYLTNTVGITNYYFSYMVM